MFNCFNSKKHCFYFSNPSLPDVPTIVPKEVDGVVKNCVEFMPQDVKSPLDGLHYEASIHSLRAKLNLGVPLSLVRPQSLDDFAVAHKKLLSSEQTIYENANKRAQARKVATKNTTESIEGE